MIKVILFDLDGTLLPMDQEIFIKSYLGLLARGMTNEKYDPKKLVESVWIGTNCMIKNNGLKTNEEVFWDKFTEIYGENSVKELLTYFDEFYNTNFDKVKESCGYNENSRFVIEEIKKLGYRIVLATNPIFPQIATKKRMAWAGLNPDDFEIYTTYENSSYCKPNTEYYLEILSKLNVSPEECLMVGNDVNEDMVASNIGIDVFLLTDCLINKDEKDISSFKQGNLNDLLQYIKNI
ncbi:MAG: HAD family hydrolase [Clostridia bacterium]|nr:HAD family hydrolase [Clostridia bacterium]